MTNLERGTAPGLSAVSIAPVKPEDHAAVLSLRLFANQEKFIASNEESLEEADDNAACVALLIRAGGEIVGFAMYALDADDGNYWIYRLMIDARFQRQGYGSAALMQIIQHVSALPGCTCIMLGVHPANDAARRLYAKAGFQETGEIIGGEVAMRYDF